MSRKGMEHPPTSFHTDRQDLGGCIPWEELPCTCGRLLIIRVQILANINADPAPKLLNGS